MKNFFPHFLFLFLFCSQVFGQTHNFIMFEMAGSPYSQNCTMWVQTGDGNFQLGSSQQVKVSPDSNSVPILAFVSGSAMEYPFSPTIYPSASEICSWSDNVDPYDGVVHSDTIQEQRLQNYDSSFFNSSSSSSSPQTIEVCSWADASTMFLEGASSGCWIGLAILVVSGVQRAVRPPRFPSD